MARKPGIREPLPPIVCWPGAWPNATFVSSSSVMDLSKEPESVFKLYGEEARNPGTFAANCLLARRLAERNVRFIQLCNGPVQGAGERFQTLWRGSPESGNLCRQLSVGPAPGRTQRSFHPAL